MFCLKCGKELPEGAMFCPFCGSGIEIEKNESMVESSINDDAGSTSNSSNSNNMSHVNGNPQGLKWIIRILLVIFVIILLKSCFGGKSNSGKESAAEKVAKGVISEQLNDPSSATWNSTEVLEKDNYDRYLVKVDVTATNGFGGRVRNRYYVIVWTDGKRYRYSNDYAWGTEGKTDINILKIMNDWNEEHNY